MRNVEVVVHGTPAPQGSKRHVGKGIMVESSAKLKPWREAVKFAALMQTDKLQLVPLSGPLHVRVTFTLQKPSSAPKRSRIWPTKRPDLDKLIRSTFDALGDAGIWRDDSQVVSVHASKVFPREGDNSLGSPGAWIQIVEVEA